MVHRAHKAQALILRRVVLDGGGSFHGSEQREYLLCVLPGIFSLRAEGSIALRNCVPYSQRAAAGAGNAEYPADILCAYVLCGLQHTALYAPRRYHRKAVAVIADIGIYRQRETVPACRTHIRFQRYS